jgi:hypothetical protein
MKISDKISSCGWCCSAGDGPKCRLTQLVACSHFGFSEFSSRLQMMSAFPAPRVFFSFGFSEFQTKFQVMGG